VTRRLRIALSFCASIACVAALSACGSSVPSGDIAQVGSAAVTKAQFNHWMVVANDSNYINAGTAAPPLPVPPDYSACIAHDLAAAATSASKPTANQVKAECAAQYNALTQTVVAYLVQAIWIQGEAAQLGVHVGEASVMKTFASQRKSEFATTAKFNHFLALSGETMPDLYWRTLLNLLKAKIVAKVEANANKISAAKVKNFYKSHRSEFSQPARRNIELVLVGSPGTAAQVKSLLAGGANFASVAKQYSTDPTTKDAGGVADGVEKGEETAIFSTAIFAASVGTLEGPVKTAFGYYIFKVISSTPASTESLATATTAIKYDLTQTADSTALNTLQTGFTKTWRARTQCASGFLVAGLCANAPSVAATGASGSTGNTASSSTAAG
jgi:foldase protein PrsA